MKWKCASGRGGIFGLAALLAVVGGAASAEGSELYVAGYGNNEPGWSRVWGFDTETGATVDSFAVDSLYGLRGVGFRSSRDLYVTDHNGVGSKFFHFTGGTGSWSQQSVYDNVRNQPGGPFFSKGSGVARGPDNRLYVAGQTSQNVWAFGDDAFEKDDQGVWRNVGPRGDVVGTPGDYYVRDVAFDPYTLERATIDHMGRLRIYGSGGMREINARVGFANTYGITYDYTGRAMTGEDGKLLRDSAGNIVHHSLVYVATTAGVLRYDAVTGEAYGANGNTTDPTLVAIGGGLTSPNDVIFDPNGGDGYLYVSDYSAGTINRYNPQTGQAIGNEEGSAVVFSGIHNPAYMAFRPGVQEYSFDQAGEYVIGSGGGFVHKSQQDTVIHSSQKVVVTLADGTVSTGVLEVGGAAGDDATLKLDNPNAQFSLTELAAKQGGTIQVQISLEVGGNLIAAGGGNLIATGGGNLIATGGGNLIAAGGGNLIAAGGGNLIAAGGGNIIGHAGSNLIAAGGGNLIATGGGNIIGHAGSNFSGTGLFQAAAMQLSAGASLRPGASPGTLTVEADLLLEAGALLEIELAGFEQGVDYDLLKVLNGEEGITLLEGDLVVKLLDGIGALIDADDVFTVLTSESVITGSFGNLLDGRVLTADGRGSFAVSYGDGGHSLVLNDFVAVPEPASLAVLGLGGLIALRRRR